MEVVEINGSGIGTGHVRGEALVTKEPISFNSGVDPTTGVVIEVGHELRGQCVTGKILVFPVGKGSTGGASVLYDLSDRGLAPLAIINSRGDTVIVTGCVMGKIPLVHQCDKDPVTTIATGDMVEIEPEKGTVRVFKKTGERRRSPTADATYRPATASRHERTLRLSDSQKRILDGDLGEPVRQGMELTVELAKFWEASTLIPVRSVHTPGAGAKSARQAGRKYIRWAADRGAKMTTVCTLNPGAADTTGVDIGLSEQTLALQAEITDSYRRLGAIDCHTCTPYLVGNAPRFGEHVCWGESSAVLYANSVLGARTNREGAPSALAAALTGFTAGYGMHLKENRLATVHIDVDYPLEAVSDFASAGYYAAKNYPDALPVFTGFPEQCSPFLLKALCASLGSSGSVSMFHAVGITPEAPTLRSATGGRKIQTITIGKKERDETVHFLNRSNDSSELDCVFIGCPHLDFEEIALVAKLLKDRKIKSGVSLWLFAPHTLWDLCERSGLTREIKSSGAMLISGTCPFAMVFSDVIASRGFKSGATNSAKLAHYMPSTWGLKMHYGSTADTIEAAVTGRWKV